MLSHWVILLVAAAYLGLLFAVAYYGDKRADAGRSIIANPYIYTLSIAVYCTAWTFYGSVGRAAGTGVGFLPIYLGPTLMVALWWLVLRKIIRIAKFHRITSIADFVGSRYGKSTVLGGLVTIIAVVGILPYISLQLKAVSTSFHVIRHHPETAMPHTAAVPLWGDTALYVALLMAAFTILFGTRHIDATERHEGMVAAIAFESIVKLVAFLAVGIFVTFALFAGPADLFARAAASPELARLMTLEGLPGGVAAWLSLTFLSMLAIMFLPRQFQVTVVENVNEEHLRTALWLFPLYLLVINLFVLPLAFGGLLLLPQGSVDPDTFVLTLPLADGHRLLALFVFVGGLSAATGMVIVEAIALSTMVCNDLVMPVLLRLRALRLTERRDLSGLLIGIRRGTIVLVLLLGYLYYRLIGESFALVTIGLVSFAAAAQFAPPILIGIYWRGANLRGASAGLIAGFAVWAYTLLLPSFAKSGWLPMDFVDHGLFGLELLKPYALFGLQGFDSITHSVIWSMLANIGGVVGVSLLTRQSAIEQVQAALFVDIFRRSVRGEEAQYWRGTATVADLHALAARFLGESRANAIFADYAAERGASLKEELEADPQLVNRVERLLAGAIGAASARVMVSSIVKGEALSMEGVMQILDETSQVMEYSRRLEQKSAELEAATEELRAANERLKEVDRLKDEFVATVSHELRTPLTSIRAFSEILHDNPRMVEEQRARFLEIVVKETERLTRLVNDVLDLAKMESGSMEWRMERLDLRDVVTEAEAAVSQLYRERDLALSHALPERTMLVLGDRDRLLQVMINLLANAAKFCAPRVGRVEISLSVAGGKARVDVSDNGPGIPPEHLDRIFEKFHQVTDTEQGKPQGSGLGLPISQRIVMHHGGHIWVQSTVGKGTTLSFSLPLARDEVTRKEILNA
ncbi:histidine kinase [Sulfurifustis variabilis]|uniref:histidine kinase n=1 Tax=Sulfurifustis variabilis TaxID=1675686 RepID=A0A1B4V3W3_9GAMM|nr:sensor histidine kinase [Sulfurifustis variabilis]BAU47212.1 histidine kinase [Sulfurifustis variabilis]